MAQVTYHTNLANAVTVFTGFTTGASISVCNAEQSVFGVKYILTTSLPACDPSYRFDPGGTSSISGPGWVFHARTAAYTAATIITGVHAKVYYRQTAQRRIFFQAYTSGGALDSTSTGYGNHTATTTNYFTINMTGVSVTVPAGGYFVIRTDLFTAGNGARWYCGLNCKAAGNVSGLFLVDETAAATGPTGTAAAILSSSIEGAATGIVEKPHTSHIYGMLYMSDGVTSVPSGTVVRAYNAADHSYHDQTTITGTTATGIYPYNFTIDYYGIEHPDFYMTIAPGQGLTDDETVCTKAVTPE